MVLIMKKKEKLGKIRKIPKGKKYLKNGQKKMSKMEKFFANIKFQKNTHLEGIYFCYVIASQNKNSDFWSIFL